VTSENYLFFFGVFIASGFFLWLVGAAFFDRHLGSDSIYRAPWLGYALLAGSLQFVHLVFPIQKGISIAVIAGLTLAAFCSLFLGGAFKGWMANRRTALGSVALLLGVSFLAFVPVLNGCTKSMCHIDLGLYYLKLIRWTQTFPIVPGLVNVQEQLAFNQNAFLVTSLFDSLIPNRWGLFLIAGLFPWLGLSLSLCAVVKLFMGVGKSASTPPMEVAYAISLPAWLSTLASFSLSSASPDCIITCLSIHFFLVFACYLVSDDETERIRGPGEILLLGVTCATVKSSSLGLVLGAWLITAIVLIVRRRKELLQILRSERDAAMSVLAAVFLGTWMLRGILLSGYPIFPSTALAMPVPWRMPTKEIIVFQQEILRSARDPEAGLDPKKVVKTWQWFSRWCERVSAMRTHFAWPAQIGVAGAASILAASLCIRVLRRRAWDLLLLVFPLVVYSVFWFISAPEPRYFGSTMWIFAICPALTFATGDRRIGRSTALACFGAAAIPISFLAWEYRWAWTYAEDRLPRYLTVETEPVTNQHGVVVWMNPGGLLTYDAPLPSSWKKRPFLALLDPDKGIAVGFKFLKPSPPSKGP
jgi:hypothetical protein